MQTTYEAPNDGRRISPVSPLLAHLPQHKVTFENYYREGQGTTAFYTGQNLPTDREPLRLDGKHVVVKVYAGFGSDPETAPPPEFVKALDELPDYEIEPELYEPGAGFGYLFAEIIDDGETLEIVPPLGPAPIGFVSMRCFSEPNEVARAVAAVYEYLYGDEGDD